MPSPQLSMIKYYTQVINKMAMIWVIHLMSLLYLPVQNMTNIKRNKTQPPLLGYSMENPTLSGYGLKHDDEKDILPLLSWTEICILSTHWTGFSLSHAGLLTTQSLKASCYGHLKQRAESVGN